MCVAITLDIGANLALDEIERMNRANADGVGVAWAWGGKVHWAKTTQVDPREVLELIDYWQECPRLVHFRLSTAGGIKDALCHPFEIGPTANCKPESEGNKVMIHNGHWHRWTELAKLLDDEGLLPDKGPWSDSRLAALLADQDEDWLQALGGRVATLDAAGTIKRLGDWSELRNGIYVSNKHWETCTVQRGGYRGYKSWPGWHGTAGWDDDTGEYHVPGTKDSSKIGAKKEDADVKKETRAERRERYLKRGDYEYPEGSGKWWRWDFATQEMVDVTADHIQSTGAKNASKLTTGRPDDEIAP